jgi:hypothetical protein
MGFVRISGVVPFVRETVPFVGNTVPFIGGLVTLVHCRLRRALLLAVPAETATVGVCRIHGSTLGPAAPSGTLEPDVHLRSG